MDAVLLTWRWSNLLTIWLMVAILAIIIAIIGQTARRAGGSQ